MSMTLRAARVNRGLTQSEASKLIGVSPYTLSNWESGKTFPDAIQILKIQEVYGVAYDDLIFLPKDYALGVISITEGS